ncbi:MAG TPA: hypothetical protein VF572_00795 [Candidatus Saccharimonadales bacterium]|jgi:uncharacterized protein involved in tolerance to divalent cations
MAVTYLPAASPVTELAEVVIACSSPHQAHGIIDHLMDRRLAESAEIYPQAPNYFADTTVSGEVRLIVSTAMHQVDLIRTELQDIYGKAGEVLHVVPMSRNFITDDLIG